MSLILSIETATYICSVALSEGDRIIAIRETNEKNAHSRLLTVFIDEILNEAGIKATQLDAIAVSEGPGSYTGLRIGVSAAKGICYAIGKPLIDISTLKALALAMQYESTDGDLLIPAIDARRMEIYTAVYDLQLNELTAPGSVIVDEFFFRNLPGHKRIIMAGDGAAKCVPIAEVSDRIVLTGEVHPSAKSIARLAWLKYQEKDFADTAYFEPFYMKEFLAGKPSVKGLQ